MEDWIRIHKEDTSEDHIIFRADDEQVNAEFEEGQAGQSKSRMNFNKMNPEQRRQNMNDQDWQEKFEQLVKEYRIDFPEEYYHEEIGLKDSNQLNEIFSELEEQNLYLIRASQDLEQSVEQQQQFYNDLRKNLEAESLKIVQNRGKLESKVQESSKQQVELEL